MTRAPAGSGTFTGIAAPCRARLMPLLMRPKTTYWLRLPLLGCAVLLTSFLFAQNVVTGKVTDEDGVELIGVSVYPEGRIAAGTVTDIDGLYTITLNDDESRLVFSYVGYETTTVDVKGRTKVNVRMPVAAELIKEVVVIGYGEALAEDVIGSVEQVTEKQIANIPVGSFVDAISGQAAGVTTRLGSGRPGVGSEIIIRGISTTSNNQPLLVIDDVIYGNADTQVNSFLSLIDPNDIESINIIKDASGKAIYGSRAANGLIIIKTKRGRKSKKPQISFNTYVGVQTIPQYEVPDVLNATELATFHREKFYDRFLSRNNGMEPTEDDYPEQLRGDVSRYGEGTNYWEALTRNGGVQNYNVSVRGGSEGLRYNVSLGHFNQEGVVIESGLKRYNLRLNVDADINKWLSLGLDLAPSMSNADIGRTDPGTGQFNSDNVLNVARWADPTGRLYDDNGQLTQDTRGVLTQFYANNPVGVLKGQKLKRINRQLAGSLRLTARLPVEGLSVTTALRTVFLNNIQRDFRPAFTNAGGITPSFSNLQSSNRAFRYESFRLISENTLNFNRSFGQHNIDAFIGYTAEKQDDLSFQGSASRLINDDFPFFSSGNVPITDPNDPEERVRIFFGASEGLGQQRLLSYLGRAAYNFDKRYYLTATVRRDGSSRFGPDVKFAVFPSFAVAWRASEEAWFPKSDALSNLRIEAAYGFSGNNRLPNYGWQGFVRRADYLIGDRQVVGNQVANPENPDLSWEETEQTDIGIELGLFRNRLNLEVDFYRALTNGLLFLQQLPNITGFGFKRINLGQIENRGVEFTINSQPIIRDDFVWNLGANLTINRNKALQLGVDDIPIFRVAAGNGTTASITEVGRPVAQYYGLQIIGLLSQEDIDDPEVAKYPGAVVGAPKILDVNGDGVINRFSDRTYIGDPFDDFTFGINTFVAWKAFSLRVTAVGAVGGKILDLNREILLNTDDGNGDLLGTFNLLREVQDRYRFGSTDFSTRIPSTLTAGSSQHYRWPTSAGVKDGDYLRINNVKLAYKLNDVLERIESLRGGEIYFSVQNALLFTPYEGNPEIRRANGGALDRNINYSSYPSTRTFTVGMSFQL